MRIIKRVEPKKEKPWKKTVKCHHCTSTLEIDEFDIFRSAGRAPCEIENDYDDVWFKCGVCETENRVPDNQINPRLRNNISIDRLERDRTNLPECIIVKKRINVDRPDENWY